MLTVGNTSGEPATAFWAVAEVSGECLEPSQYRCLVLPSLVSVSFLLPALSSNNTTLGRDVVGVQIVRSQSFPGCS